MFIKKTILLLIITIVLISCATTRNHWELAKDKNTIDGYREFLFKYPESEYADTARANIDLLSYTNALKSNTIASYEYYISEFPSGQKLNEAKKRIEDLKFDDILQKDSLDSYVGFLKEYPQSTHSKVIEQKIETIEWKNTIGKHTIEDYKIFRDKYPDSSQIDIIASLIEEIKLANSCEKGSYQACKYYYFKAIELKEDIRIYNIDHDYCVDQAERNILRIIENYYENKKYDRQGLGEISRMLKIMGNKKSADMAIKFFMDDFDTKEFARSNFIAGFINYMDDSLFNKILNFPADRNRDIIRVIDESDDKRGISKLISIVNYCNQKDCGNLCILSANVLGKLKAGPEAAIPVIQCLNRSNSGARYAMYSVNQIKNIQGFIEALIKFYKNANLEQKCQTLMTILELGLLEDNDIQTKILNDVSTCDNRKCYGEIIRQGQKNTELDLVKSLTVHRYHFMAEALLNSNNRTLTKIGDRFRTLFNLQIISYPVEESGLAKWGDK